MKHRTSYPKIARAQAEGRCVRCRGQARSEHQEEHPGFCCECFNVICGKPESK